jgi:GNAT superfamily N-acetyltransferase
LLRYREATPADWEAVAAVHALSWQKAYRGALSDEFLDGPVVDSRRARWEERFANVPENQYVVLVQDEGGALVGFAAAYGAHHAELGTLLDNLHVLPELQGEGVGRQLVARMAAWALERYPGCVMYLEVLEGNERARRFYERLGGTDASGDTWDAPDGQSHAVRRYTWSRERMQALAAAVRD